MQDKTAQTRRSSRGAMKVKPPTNAAVVICHPQPEGCDVP